LKFGIYYSYWEQEWSADCLKYVEKVAKLGFDVIEIAAHHLNSYSPAHIAEVGRSARDNGITLTAGLGPSQQRNLSSADPAIRKAGRAFFEETLTNLAKLDIHVIGGALHSYWPIDYSKPVDKPGDRARGLEGISNLASFADNLGINLCLEVLNRFENHVLNTAEEGVAFVKEIGKPNVKVMLDTFHMNIEEDSFGKAIRTAGPLLGHFHTGENNRRVPGKGGLPWHEIGTALPEAGYGGGIVMEPFVKMGGQVGSDIRVWRDLSDNAGEAQLSEEETTAPAPENSTFRRKGAHTSSSCQQAVDPDFLRPHNFQGSHEHIWRSQLPRLQKEGYWVWPFRYANATSDPPTRERTDVREVESCTNGS
jgi:D-psicose/D-tagatose/L-ribulose 3-epimerase